METDAPVRVMALHALAYCERLFYLEEVEEIRVADDAVFAGRALHEEVAAQPDGDVERHTLESDALGVRGVVDVLRVSGGEAVPYEHKRGRSRREGKAPAEAWPSDRLQALAYGLLVRDCLGLSVSEVRVRYHADNVLVTIPLDGGGESEVRSAVARARELRQRLDRPPVASNERLCVHCSLAPVCLPEEERVADDPQWEPVRLFPPDPDTMTLHVVTPGAKVGRAGDGFAVTAPGEAARSFGAEQVGGIVLHGAAQVSTQALALCAEHGVGVHWVTGGGRYLGAFVAGPGPVQRRLRQYQALSDEAVRLRLVRRLVGAKVTSQVKFLLRATRGRDRTADGLSSAIALQREALRRIPYATAVDELRGLEGLAGKAYFGALPALIRDEAPRELIPAGRSRRPPLDPFNALLSFGYALLHKDVQAAILAVGLEPALGIMHAVRSAAHPLPLDLMELFRVAIVDIAVLASVNRLQWKPDEDFVRTGKKVWLSESGRRKAIEVYERRKQERWRHPVTGYSLSYGRLIELEVRLLEKEWTGKPGLFGRMVLR